ncbi:kinase D-interacting substrate of 220 kDa-like [Haliotis cracherodii]|uniref:kinase D-interacting substrate of 220 kDa-like n=1 Tax=Haliotis cracherodii TaxID=6455 RepID=UPI0039E98B69
MPKYILLVIIFVLQGNGEECPLGKYGVTCEEVCSPNCAPSLTDQSVHCHKLTGRCSEGCKRGWHGDQCNDLCSKNCLNSICNVQTGTCINCEVNYSGDYCETSGESGTKQETASTPLAVILVLVFAILIIIIIIITVTVYRWRRSKQALGGETGNADEGDNLIDSRNTTAVDTSPSAASDSDFQTPDTDLIVACKQGKLQRVRDILDKSSEDIDKKDCGGMTPVMWAARRGHIEVLDLLVKKGADVSLKDKVGHNILHWACYGRNFAMVKYVLSLNKVDINNTGLDGRTPAMFAARQGYMKLFELLVSKGGLPKADKDGNNILLLACCGGNVEIVKYIISHKTVDINSGGQSNRTPLMVAAYRGNEKVVDLLMKEEADLTLVGDAGDNVLHSACQGGHVDIVKRVVELVDISSPGQYNRTPLMMAARRGEKEIFDLLVKKEAASCVDDDGNNILHLASEGGHLEIVKYILENMMDISDINARNKHNETAAMLAPRGSEVSDLLVSRYKVLMK